MCYCQIKSGQTLAPAVDQGLTPGSPIFMGVSHSHTTMGWVPIWLVGHALHRVPLGTRYGRKSFKPLVYVFNTK